MGLFGKILSVPIRLANVPARVIELSVAPDSERGDPDNIASAPLELLAKAVEEVDD